MIDYIWSVFTETIGLRWLLFNTLISIIIYQYVIKDWSFFKRNNVKYVRGLPFLGAQWRFLTGRESILHSTSRIYKYFSNEKITGIFDIGSVPTYIIRDPEIIKQISIKDFDHFINHRSFGDTDQEPLLGRSLFVMRDQRWKSMRSLLSPAFTGSKMRLMFSLIGDVSKTFNNHLKNEISANGSIDCDIRDKFSRFTNDAIASCAFGINIDSMEDKDNEFYRIGSSLSNFTGFTMLLKFIGIFTMPKVLKYLNITLLNQKDITFFRKIVKDNMEYREKNGIVRNDMINILMQIKKGTLTGDSENEKETDGDMGFATVQESTALSKDSSNQIQNWDEDDLIAQSMIFFLAGFSNIALTLSFIAHDLAIHQDVQAKLYEEIRETNENLNGKPLSYETLQKMKYLDMVVSESMRMWPQAPANDRVVSKTYELEIEDNRKVVFNPGEVVIFPTHGLHNDPKYFPNPDQFDPERFSDENKGNIVAGTYLPFGIGPRNCIASRFALMETKACVYHLLANCKLDLSPRTQHPLQLRVSGSVEAKDGFWVKLKSRE